MTGTIVALGALGALALTAGVITGVALRLRRRPAAAEPDTGLLVTVAVLSSRQDAELTVRLLASERVRSTVAASTQGWLLLVFPDQAAAARGLLHAS